MSTIPIILLAAGQSSRMGGADKLMRPIDGVPLLRRSAMIANQIGPVVVALPPAPHPRYEVLRDLDVRLAEITDAAEGMNASLRGALSHIPETARAAMVLLADLPDLTAEDLRAVLASTDRFPNNLIWRGACADGTPGHPVIFDRTLFAELRSLEGDGGAQNVVRAHKSRVHLHPLPGRHAVFDLDTPQDWAAWEAAQT
ncbi:CTP:molybdopterin cytidylyltransferase MocA [Ruegeria lacuscaerulensis ITI-1157]|nr:CTP:molybdopterin cytidylyltransferase MocA [Ruegeria lacuscaerulensis ITI-1157]